METRTPSAEYEDIAAELVRTEPSLAHIAESGARIAFLASDTEKRSRGRTVYGECEKVPDKWKWAVPYDFAVTVFQPNVERFTDAQLRILLLHELLHVGVEVDGNEESYRVRPHDVEDFHEVLERFGTGWQR